MCIVQLRLCAPIADLENCAAPPCRRHTRGVRCRLEPVSVRDQPRVADGQPHARHRRHREQCRCRLDGSFARSPASSRHGEHARRPVLHRPPCAPAALHVHACARPAPMMPAVCLASAVARFADTGGSATCTACGHLAHPRRRVCRHVVHCAHCVRRGSDARCNRQAPPSRRCRTLGS